MLTDYLGRKFDSIADAVESKLNDYDGGELETMAYRIDKLTEFAGKLTELLVKKKIITEEELEEIL